MLSDETRQNVLVGFENSDDAAVYQLDPQTGIVASVDMFTPIVDDPYDFGRIAAANALSDIYAMGGRPLFALSVIGFPVNELPIEVMGKILQGGSDISAKAGISIVGGHSIDDREPKFGLCVVGHVSPKNIIRNNSPQLDDCLILTKPIGSGIIATGIKRDLVTQDVMTAAVDCMTTLNRDACDVMLEVGVSAATDVTGFGLLGHLHEMLSEHGAFIDSKTVPLLKGTYELAQQGVIPGGTKRNEEQTQTFVTFDSDVDPIMKSILFDAQTSGGLLMAVPQNKASMMMDALTSDDRTQSAMIGHITDAAGHIHVS